MISFRINRRRVLAMLGACLPFQHAASALGSVVAEKGIGDRLVELFARPSSAAAIGDAYLAQSHEPADAAVLLETFIRTDAEQGMRLDELTTTELREYVQRRIARDFESGRTARVNGWVFSQSELLLYALASVSS